MNIQGIKTVVDCLIVSQLYYLAKIMNFKEFYKTDEELAKEIRIPLITLKKHKNKMKKINGLEIITRGCPRKTFYLLSQKIFAQLNSINQIPPVVSNRYDRKYQLDTSHSINQIPSYIEQKNTTEDYNKEEEARASNSSAALPLPFLESYYKAWADAGTEVSSHPSIANWFNTASDGDKGLAISNVARCVKVHRQEGRSPKDPWFYLKDRTFEKAYVVDTPLALTENRKAQSTTLTNNHSPEIQKQLIEELGEPVYKSWFEQCHIAQSGCDIEVTAPNNFVKETVEELLGQSMFRRSYNSIKVMVAEFVCVLVEYFEPIEQCCCLLLN